MDKRLIQEKGISRVELSWNLVELTHKTKGNLVATL